MTARTKSVASGTLRGLGYVATYLMCGILTSTVAALFGVSFILLAGLGWRGVLDTASIPAIPIFGFLIGFLLSTPVTFVVLPASALLFKGRPATQLFVLAVSGAIAGGCTIWLSIALLVGHAANQSTAAMFIVTGTAAGTIAGMMYARIVRAARN